MKAAFYRVALMAVFPFICAPAYSAGLGCQEVFAKSVAQMEFDSTRAIFNTGMLSDQDQDFTPPGLSTILRFFGMASQQNSAKASLNANNGIFSPISPFGKGFTPTGDSPFSPKNFFAGAPFSIFTDIWRINPLFRIWLKTSGPLGDPGPAGSNGPLTVKPKDPKFHLWDVHGPLGITGIYGLACSMFGVPRVYGYKQRANGLLNKPDSDQRAKYLELYGHGPLNQIEITELYRDVEAYMEVVSHGGPEGGADDAFFIGTTSVLSSEEYHEFPVATFEDETKTLLVAKTEVAGDNPVLEIYLNGELVQRVDSQTETNVAVFRAKQGEIYRVRILRPKNASPNSNLEYRFLSHKYPI